MATIKELGGQKALNKTISTFLDAESVQNESDSLLDQDFGREDCWRALACGYLDLLYPGKGFDIMAHKHLENAAAYIENHDNGIGVFEGLSGFAFSASYLSRGFTRYIGLLSNVNKVIVAESLKLADMIASTDKGLPTYYFDVVSGASGIAGYLLYARKLPRMNNTLKILIKSLVEAVLQKDGLARFYTPYNLQAGWKKKHYRNGSIDCGLSHGLGGPLSLLSLAYIEGVKVSGMDSAIDMIVQWLLNHERKNKFGMTNWPGAMPVELSNIKKGSEYDALSQSHYRYLDTSRAAWCYGSPGIARAIFLGGKALHNDGYIDKAIDTMASFYGSPFIRLRLESPTFCHGVAGVLQISLRFMNDVEDSIFRKNALMLAKKLVSMYAPKSILGYRNVVGPERFENNNGLLEGTIGIAMVLLAATSDIEPKWDRVFLLS